jgi:hypothetical protein
VLSNSLIQLSLQNESVEPISLNECISNAGHGFLCLTKVKPDKDRESDAKTYSRGETV